MNGTRLVQLHLLSQMRATDLVHQACYTLGASDDEVEAGAKEAESLGLLKPGHPMTLYTKLLGEPLSRRTVNHRDPYQCRVETYMLPLWPDYAFAVHGSDEGVTSCGMFSPLPNTNPKLPSQLVPWKVIEEDVKPLLAAGRIVDEWYPMKDYLCPRGVGDQTLVVLQFDFSLLQTIRTPDPAAKENR